MPRAAARLLVLLTLAVLSSLAFAQFTLDGDTPTGGTAVNTFGPPSTYSLSNTNWYGGTSATGATCSCNGTIQYHWTWQGADPAPSTVILKVESTASWGNSSAPPGACDDGLEQNDDPNDRYAGDGTTVIAQSPAGTKYVVANVTSDGKVAYSITPTASAPTNPPSQRASATVATRITLTPITIDVAGTQLFQGSLQCIVGLQQSATVSATLPVGNQTWSVGGPVQPSSPSTSPRPTQTGTTSAPTPARATCWRPILTRRRRRSTPPRKAQRR